MYSNVGRVRQGWGECLCQRAIRPCHM